MALQKNIEFKGLKVNKAYAYIKSFYTKKVNQTEYEVSAHFEICTSEAKENVLYCATEEMNIPYDGSEIKVKELYNLIKKLPSWKGWKDA